MTIFFQKYLLKLRMIAVAVAAAVAVGFAAPAAGAGSNCTLPFEAATLFYLSTQSVTK